jgi:hypothetical protein
MRILDLTSGIHGVSIGMPGDLRTYGVTATYSF